MSEPAKQVQIEDKQATPTRVAFIEPVAFSGAERSSIDLNNLELKPFGCTATVTTGFLKLSRPERQGRAAETIYVPWANVKWWK